MKRHEARGVAHKIVAEWLRTPPDSVCVREGNLTAHQTILSDRIAEELLRTHIAALPPLKLRVFKRHTKDCEAVRECIAGRWTTPWYFDADETVYADARGYKSKHGRHRWLRLRCNSNNCNAEVWARALELEEEVEKVLRRANENGGRG
jgi:hypothetical protein